MGKKRSSAHEDCFPGMESGYELASPLLEEELVEIVVDAVAEITQELPDLFSSLGEQHRLLQSRGKLGVLRAALLKALSLRADTAGDVPCLETVGRVRRANKRIRKVLQDACTTGSKAKDKTLHPLVAGKVQIKFEQIRQDIVQKLLSADGAMSSYSTPSVPSKPIPSEQEISQEEDMERIAWHIAVKNPRLMIEIIKAIDKGEELANIASGVTETDFLQYLERIDISLEATKLLSKVYEGDIGAVANASDSDVSQMFTFIRAIVNDEIQRGDNAFAEDEIDDAMQCELEQHGLYELYCQIHGITQQTDDVLNNVAERRRKRTRDAAVVSTSPVISYPLALGYYDMYAPAKHIQNRQPIIDAIIASQNVSENN